MAVARPEAEGSLAEAELGLLKENAAGSQEVLLGRAWRERK